MAEPSEVDIEIRDNEDWIDNFFLADEFDVPLDLSAVTLSLHVRRAATDSEAVLIASDANQKIKRYTGACYRVAITNMGASYPAATTVSFSGGGSDPGKILPAGRVILGTGPDAGKIVGVVLDEVGRNMTQAPSVSFTGSGGSNAAATAIIGTMCAFDMDWAGLSHLSGSYVHDLVANEGDVRKVLFSGRFTVVDGVTR